MELKICGAAQEVTGSAHLLTLDSGLKILLDCGMFQGSAYEHLNEKLKEIIKNKQKTVVIMKRNKK